MIEPSQFLDDPAALPNPASLSPTPRTARKRTMAPAQRTDATPATPVQLPTMSAPPRLQLPDPTNGPTLRLTGYGGSATGTGSTAQAKPTTPYQPAGTSAFSPPPGLPGGPTEPAYSPPNALGQGHAIPTTPPVQQFPSSVPGLPGGPTQPAYSPPNALGQGHAVPTPALPLQPSPPGGGLFTPSTLPGPGAIVPTSPIDPANDLRSQSVLPSSTAQIDQARQGLIDATGNMGTQDRSSLIASLMSKFGITPTDVSAGPAVSTDPSSRLSRYNGLVDDAASKLAGVDRVALAKDLLSQFDEQQLPEHELALRKLTEKYAARGGGRSGQLRTEYGNEDLTRQRDRDLFKRGLISDALNGSIQDQFNKTNALSGLQSSIFGQDATTRGETRADRQYQTDVATGNANRRLAAQDSNRSFASDVADRTANDATTRTAAAQNLFNTLTGEQSNNRAETRGERDYQNQLEGQSYTRALTQQQLEQQQQAQQLNQALAMLAAGEGGNPSDVLARLANGGGLDAQTVAELAKLLGSSGGGSQTASTSIPTGVQIPDYGGILS